MLVCQWISQVPPHCLHNHLAWVLASLERIGYGNRHGFLPYQILTCNGTNSDCDDADIPFAPGPLLAFWLAQTFAHGIRDKWNDADKKDVTLRCWVD